MSKRDTIKMSVKSFDELRKLIDSPPPPTPALVSAFERYKANSSHDPVTETTTINMEEATMQK